MAFQGGNLAAVEDPQERQIREPGNLYTSGYLFEKQESPEDLESYESLEVVEEELPDDVARRILEFPFNEANDCEPTSRTNMNKNADIAIEYGDILGSSIASNLDQVTDTITVNLGGSWADTAHMVPVPATSVRIISPSMVPISPISAPFYIPSLHPSIEISCPTGQISHPGQAWPSPSSNIIRSLTKLPPRPTVEDADDVEEWQAPIAPMHTPFTPESMPHPLEIPFRKEAAPLPESPEPTPTLRRSKRRRVAPKRYVEE